MAKTRHPPGSRGMDFWEEVRPRLRRLGWSDAELARRADMSNSSLSRILNQTKVFGPKTVRKIVDALRTGELHAGPDDAERRRLVAELMEVEALYGTRAALEAAALVRQILAMRAAQLAPQPGMILHEPQFRRPDGHYERRG